MNPFTNWKASDVDAHNARVRMKTAKQRIDALIKAATVVEGKRVRQGEPKANLWEQEWMEVLEELGFWKNVKAQSIRVRLANGAWYKPDVSASHNGKLYCWDVKGGKKMKGAAKGVLAIKVAASQYPEIEWILCWKENGVWKQQVIFP